MIPNGKKIAAAAAVSTLLFTACRDTGGDTKSTAAAAPSATEPGASAATDPAGTQPEATTVDSASTDTTPETTPATEPAGEAWTVNVDDCADPAAATAAIEGEVKIGAAQPLSGTPAIAFAPVKEGMELYFKYANDNNLLDGHTISVSISDDQYDPTQTPGVVSSLIDDNVAIFSGIIGSPNNLAVRDTLNEECIPQLLSLTGSPDWGDSTEYPWTTGALVPYDIESKIYATKMKELGVKTVGLFSVNNEFGKVYVDGFKEAAAEAGLEIIDEQTIEPADQTPPTNQLGSIVGKKPDAVMTIPLGTQCPTFTKELVNAKAVAGDWNPIVFLTNTCSSRLLIDQLAAGSGDGVYTSNFIVDPSDPKFADQEGVKAFKAAYDAAGLAGDLATTATGWTVAESTVKTLIKAAESGTLSRQSIIEASRNLQFVPSLGRDGTIYKMNGDADAFAYESLTVLQWNQASGTFTEIGEQDLTHES